MKNNNSNKKLINKLDLDSLSNNKNYILIEYDKDHHIDSQEYLLAKQDIINHPDTSNCLVIFELEDKYKNLIITNQLTSREFSVERKGKIMEFYKLDKDLVSRLQFGKLLSPTNLTNRKISSIIMVVIYEDDGVNKMPKLTTDQRLTILESDVAVLKTDVVVLKQDVAILKQDVADIKVSLANLENKVDTLIVAFNDFAKKVDQRFDALESDVSELKTEVKVIHKKVDKLNTASLVKNLRSLYFILSM